MSDDITSLTLELKFCRNQMRHLQSELDTLKRQSQLSKKVIEDCHMMLKKHHAEAYKYIQTYPNSEFSDSTSTALRNATTHLSNLEAANPKEVK